MGSKIDSVHIFNPFFIFNKGYIPCAVKAVKKCLNDPNGYEKKVGMLVSTAIYRDMHIVEPSLSSLILGDIIRKPIFKRNALSNRLDNVLAFDLNNGACGMLQAIQLVNGYIQSGKIESGLVVAGDSVHKTGHITNYSFSQGAAAVLLSKGKEGTGFIRFSTDSYLQYRDDFEGYSHFSNGKVNLTVEEKKNYCEHTVHCAGTSLDKFLETEQLTTNDIDLVISSHYPEGFVGGMLDRFQLQDKMIQLVSHRNGFHTANPLFLLHMLFYTNRFKLAKKILFLTVGAGITTSIALYNR